MPSLRGTEPDLASRAPAVVARLEAAPAFSRPPRDYRASRPPVFVDSALSMLGGGGELIAQVVAVFAGAAPDLADQLKPAGQAALQALVAFGAALRDEIEPSPRPPCLRHRRGAVQPPPASRACAHGGPS